jgi:hypothetical protein
MTLDRFDEFLVASVTSSAIGSIGTMSGKPIAHEVDCVFIDMSTRCKLFGPTMSRLDSTRVSHLGHGDTDLGGFAHGRRNLVARRLGTAKCSDCHSIVFVVKHKVMTAWNNTKAWFVKYACFFFKLIVVILLVIVLGIIYKIASGISKLESD